MKIGNTLLKLLLAVMNILQGENKMNFITHEYSLNKLKCALFLFKMYQMSPLFAQEIEFNEIYRILRANATCKSIFSDVWSF